VIWRGSSSYNAFVADIPTLAGGTGATGSGGTGNTGSASGTTGSGGTGTSGSTGSGTAHANDQPWMAITKIIKK